MKDRYFKTKYVVKQLIRNYKIHGNLILCFDFDDTIFDYHKRGDKHPKMIHLLQYLSDRPDEFRLILHTAREGELLKYAEDMCFVLDINPEVVNENLVMKENRKIFCNLMFDDKAGLGQSYKAMIKFLKKTGHTYKYKY